jgi:hypothetical protein
MKLVVSEPAQAVIKNLDRDTARQVIDFSTLLQSAQDQQELEKLFPGNVNRLGGDFHWFVRLNEHCKIVMAFDRNDHQEPIALILNVLDSRPVKPTGWKGYLIKASRLAINSLSKPAKLTRQPQEQSAPACLRPEPVGNAAEVEGTEESPSKILADKLRRVADEQRTAARELKSRQDLQRSPLNVLFGRKNKEQLSENLNNAPPLSAAERITRDFGNLG